MTTASQHLRALDKEFGAPWTTSIYERHELAYLLLRDTVFARFDGREYLGSERIAAPLATLRNALPALIKVIDDVEHLLACDVTEEQLVICDLTFSLAALREQLEAGA